MKNLILILVFALVYTYSFATDYSVTGVSYPSNVDGIYVEQSGLKGGVPYYQNSSKWALYFDGTAVWEIWDGDSKTSFYTKSSSLTPPNVEFIPSGKASGAPTPTPIYNVPVSMWTIFSLFVLIGLFIFFRKNMFKKAEEA